MIVVGDPSTYCFHRRDKPGIHFGRIYISDVDDVRELLTIVKLYRIVSDEVLKTSSTRVRSENPREFLELLWLLKGFGIDVTRSGRNAVYVPNKNLEKILTLSDEKLKELILEKLKTYAPFVVILDKMIDYKNSGKKFTQNNITVDFSEGFGQQTYQMHAKGDYYELTNFEDKIIFVWRGDTDNTEPFCRIANPSNKGGFGLVDQPEKQINEKGEKYVQECIEDRYWFFDYNVDLDSDAVLNIITHILAKISVSATKKIEKKYLLNSHFLNEKNESKENHVETIVQRMGIYMLSSCIHGVLQYTSPKRNHKDNVANMKSWINGMNPGVELINHLGEITSHFVKFASEQEAFAPMFTDKNRLEILEDFQKILKKKYPQECAFLDERKQYIAGDIKEAKKTKTQSYKKKIKEISED